MSLYGQILYEFTKLFSHIGVNNNNINEPVAIEDSQNSLQLMSQWDQFNLSGGNHWIQLSSDVNDKKISFYHNFAHQDINAEVASVQKVDDNNMPSIENVIQLYPGNGIVVSTSNYDKAGHYINSSNQYFKLPTDSEIRNNILKSETRIQHIEDNFITSMLPEGEQLVQCGIPFNKVITNDYIGKLKVNEDIKNALNNLILRIEQHEKSQLPESDGEEITPEESPIEITKEEYTIQETLLKLIELIENLHPELPELEPDTGEDTDSEVPEEEIIVE